MKRLYYTLCLLLAFSGSSFLSAQAECLLLEAQHRLASTGTSVCVDVTADQFENMIGMQFSLKWDTAVIAFESVNNFGLPQMNRSNFGLPEVTGYSDRLSVLWSSIDNSPVSLAPETVLFSMCFEANGAPGARTRIDFDETPTQLEFIVGSPLNFHLQTASLWSGSVTIADTAPDFPDITPAGCPQANSCTEVPPAGIQTETSGGTLPYSYSWTGPDAYVAAEPNINDIQPGTYRVEVYDAVGLSNSILFYVPGNPPISLTNIDLTQLDGCDQESGGAISFEVVGGSGSYSYQWSDGAETASRTDLTAGLYQLTVTDLLLGCSTYESFTIFAAGNVRVKSAEITPVSCGTTNTGAIYLELESDSTAVSVSWNTGATGTTLENLPVGSYSATITDASGCSIEWSGQVAESNDVEFQGTVGYVDCNQNSGFITLEMPSDLADYTYAWSNGAVTKDISGLAFGSYRVTVTRTGTGCTGYYNFYLKDEDFITGSTWECTIVDDQTIFAKVSTIVWGGGTPPYTFNWSNGDSMTDDLIGSTTVSLPVTLTVTITDSKGCTTIADPITPNCNNSGGPTFTTASAYNCIEGENGNFTHAKIDYYVWDGGVGPYTFNWSTGETVVHDSQSSIIAPADALTSYTVTVTDQLGQTHISDPITPICQIDGGPLRLEIGTNFVNPGNPVCVPVQVQGFDNIAGLQFTISWDPTQLKGDSLINPILPNFSSLNYSFGPFNGQAAEGTMTFAWTSSTGQGHALSDSTARLFELCFTAIGDQDSVAVVFSNHPTIVEATTGTLQVIPVNTRNGAVYIEDSGISKVWPGDTDNNGLVDHFDLLNIGLAYGQNGYPRPDATLDWEAQFAAPWAVATPNTQVDYRHVDTDGNGTISAIDTLALAFNYRLFNENWDGEPGYTDRDELPEAARTIGTPLFVDTYLVQEGSSPVFDIVLGDDENAENTVYGLAFSVEYDPLAIVPGSIKLTFDNTWLGEVGQDLLTFYRIDAQNHRLHVAMTRTDGKDITGRGAIAQLLVTIEDVIFRSTDYEIPIAIENARLITALEEAVTVTERSSVITVGSTTTNTLDEVLDRQIKVYPVPAQGAVFLKTPQLRIETIELFDLEGRQLRYWSGPQDRLLLTDLPRGTYALRLITDQGVAVRRIVLMD